MIEACPSCGLALAGGAEGCQRLFESIGLREYEDMRFARYHRIVVDVYAMQHPDRYGRSAKSFAAHLTGLCAWLEDEDRAQSINASVQRRLSGPSPIEKPALPQTYGAVGRVRRGMRTKRFMPPRAPGSPHRFRGEVNRDRRAPVPPVVVRLSY